MQQPEWFTTCWRIRVLTLQRTATLHCTTLLPAAIFDAVIEGFKGDPAHRPSPSPVASLCCSCCQCCTRTAAPRSICRAHAAACSASAAQAGLAAGPIFSKATWAQEAAAAGQRRRGAVVAWAMLGNDHDDRDEDGDGDGDECRRYCMPVVMVFCGEERLAGQVSARFSHATESRRRDCAMSSAAPLEVSVSR